MVEEFTIMDGFASSSWPDDSGGGVYCIRGSSPTIKRCIFLFNYATWYGGAMSCRGESSPVIEQCTFFYNGAMVGAGLSCEFYSSPAIAGCTFHLNAVVDESGPSLVVREEPRGAGIACADYSYPVLTNTIISFSWAGEAVYCDGTSGADFNCSDIYGNAGGDWVGCIEDQLGINGNIWEDPLYCNTEIWELYVNCYSPCAPYQQPTCGLIGAWTVGCGVSATVPSTWGLVKSIFDTR